MKKPGIIALAVIVLAAYNLSLQGQNEKSHPKGDPEKWNVEITPFLWLPVIGGEIYSERLTEDFNVEAVDLLSNLKMAFMITAEVSKGKFFAAPTYFYTKLGTDMAYGTSPDGEDVVSVEPDMKMNIVEFVAGGRFRVEDFLVIDPFIGFRYTNYHLSGTVVGPRENTSFDESKNFWDPVIGFQVNYYPHPRVPIRLKTDIGGFGAGSELSWTASLNSGYTLSPSFDLLAGFSAYGTDYENETELGGEYGLNMVMYGFDLGVVYHIPKRAKDKSVFKKAK